MPVGAYEGFGNSPHSRKQPTQFVFIEGMQMPPGRVDFSTGLTCRSSQAGILPERDTHNNLMSCHTDQFAARPANVRNVFEYFRAKDAIKGFIRESQLGRIAGDSNNPWNFKRWPLEIEGGYLF